MVKIPFHRGLWIAHDGVHCHNLNDRYKVPAFLIVKASTRPRNSFEKSYKLLYWLYRYKHDNDLDMSGFTPLHAATQCF
jgi:hypothetical protein